MKGRKGRRKAGEREEREWREEKWEGGKRKEEKGKKRRGGSEMCSVVEHMSCETPWVESTTLEIIFQKEEEGPER